jgi:hypothetical protein
MPPFLPGYGNFFNTQNLWKFFSPAIPDFSLHSRPLDPHCANRANRPRAMSEFDPEANFENDWDERGDLAWNEFDWERYLREQDDVLHRYLAHYEKLKDHSGRIDEVAHLMGWEDGSPAGEAGLSDDSAAPNAASAGPPPPPVPSAFEPYTLHQNPVFVATKAIYLSLKRSWERLADDETRVTQTRALAVQTSLHRGEEHAILGVQALDLGDYAMAVSIFKRAMQELNRTLALANAPEHTARRSLTDWRDDALPRLFDLREIWLRVIAECREELARRVDDES